MSGGWAFRNGNLQRRTPIKDPHQLEVGQRYVGIFTHDARGPAEGGERWWCFGRIPLVGGKLGRAVPIGELGTEPIYRRLAGMAPAEAAALFNRTPPDPDVVPYLDEDALDRYQLARAAKERRATATPSPR